MSSRIRMLMSAAQALGPYLLVEILLPGGTLIALLLWLYQQWRANSHWGLGSGDWGMKIEDLEHGLAAHE